MRKSIGGDGHFSFVSQTKRNGSCCSRSSSDEGGHEACSNTNSCKNSTSGVSSCLSVCSHSKSAANMHKNSHNNDQQQMYYLQWEEKAGDNGILYGTQYYGNDKSPTSKVTVVSDYADGEMPITIKTKGRSKNYLKYRNMGKNIINTNRHCKCAVSNTINNFDEIANFLLVLNSKYGSSPILKSGIFRKCLSYFYWN